MEFSKEEIQDLIEEELKNAEKKYGKEFKKCILKVLSLEKMLMPKEKPEKEPKIIPLIKWNEFHPDPSIKALRMLVFNNPNNFVESCIERRGKRVLINEENYFKWCELNKS